MPPAPLATWPRDTFRFAFSRELQLQLPRPSIHFPLNPFSCSDSDVSPLGWWVLLLLLSVARGMRFCMWVYFLQKAVIE